MALLIRNGEIVTEGSHVQADIYAENETITYGRKASPLYGFNDAFDAL